MTIPPNYVLDTNCSQYNSYYDIDSTEETLSRFFISPKLHIEYEETPETANIFCPAQTYLTPDGMSFTRRYLRVRVKNSGYVSATNCEAKIRVSNRDVKQLVWDGAASSTVLEGVSLKKDIRARKGEELVHVVFSDSRFSNSANENLRVAAWIPTIRSIPPQNILSLEDRLVDFNIEIEILSNEGAYCKAKFTIHADRNHMSLRMDKVSDESGGKWTMIKERIFH